MRSCPGFSSKLVDNPLKFTFKISARSLTYIRRHTSLEILDLGVIMLLNIAMFVVKLTDLITENKLVNRRFLRN